MSVYKKLAEYLLPAGILDYFDLVDVKHECDHLGIYLVEKSDIPVEYNGHLYRKDGFMNERKIKDFSIRDQLVTLYVKRRRWLLKESGKKVKRDWNIVAPGTSMTKDLADFLKEIAR